MKGSGEGVQFDADSRLQQPKGVFDSFVAERVEFHGGQVGRRQTCEVGSPGRRSVMETSGCSGPEYDSPR